VTVIVVTGIQAAGKSAIARALAERLDRRGSPSCWI
jgi:adenylylsulfate kinase-like enzyme